MSFIPVIFFLSIAAPNLDDGTGWIPNLEKVFCRCRSEESCEGGGEEAKAGGGGGEEGVRGRFLVT